MWMESFLIEMKVDRFFPNLKITHSYSFTNSAEKDKWNEIGMKAFASALERQ